MTKPRVLILRAPGTNCDQEAASAFALAGGEPTSVHVNRLLEKPALCDDFQILCLPGGFSYGDDIAAGRILGNQIRHHLAESLRRFKDAGKPILGICNGFQIMVRSGILLDDHPEQGPAATLADNDSGKFECRWVRLAVNGSKCVFLEGIESLYLPVAHGEGKFVPRDGAVWKSLEENGQLVLRYQRLDQGAGEVPYPENPNGARGDVAGVCDSTGRVFGLMPHPERHVDPTHHPRWTREGLKGEGDGLAVFKNAVRFFA